MNIATARNVERTGKRRLTRLSGIARKVEGVRHLDIDLTQWCPLCSRPEAFCEVKSQVVSDAEWKQMRLHAAFWGHNCLGLLVIESSSGEFGVKVYDSAADTIIPVQWGDEDLVRSVLEKARDLHACW